MFSSDPLSEAVAWGVLLIIAAIIGYFLARWWKGSVAIEVDQLGYRLGQVINGKVRVKARRPVDYQSITLILACRHETKTCERDRSSGKSSERTRSRLIYEDKQVVADGGVIQRGRELALGFRFNLPDSLPDPAGLQVNLKLPLPPEMTEALAGLVVGTGRSRLVWTVAAEVAARGIDLGKTLEIGVESERWP